MRAILVALAALVQLLVGVLPGGLVLCVHDDGRAMFELGTALCCGADAHGDPSCSAGAEDHCQDFPLPQDRPTLSESARTLNLAHAHLILSWDEVAPADAAGEAGLGAPWSTGADPPPGWALRSTRTVVLRC